MLFQEERRGASPRQWDATQTLQVHCLVQGELAAAAMGNRAGLGCMGAVPPVQCGRVPGGDDAPPAERRHLWGATEQALSGSGATHGYVSSTGQGTGRPAW